ncbi:serine/threonine protein kinase [Lachnospiraceae bacterium 38-10]
MEVVEAFVVAMCIPSAVTGFGFWLLQRKMDKRDAEREKKEKIREKQEYLLVKSIGAAIALGEATAEAVARIPDAHCNGDMHRALEYAKKIKHEQKDFLTQQGIEAIF